MQMRLPFFAGAVGLAVTALLSSQTAVASSVLDLPAEVEITDVTLYAYGAGTLIDTSVDQGVSATRPGIYDRRDIRTSYYDPYGNSGGAIAEAWAYGMVYAKLGGSSAADAQQVSAKASWVGTLTNVGTQSRRFFGSFMLEKSVLAGALDCCSGAATMTVGATTYQLRNDPTGSFSQSFNDFTLAPGQSIQLSLTLDALESGLAGYGGTGEYEAKFSIESAVSAVPEPSTVLLQAVGLAALLAVRRRRAGTRRG